MWSAGQTSVSMVQLTVDSRDDADMLLSALFKQTLIADAEQIFQDVSRTYLSERGTETKVEKLNKLFMLTSDNRVPELIEEIAKLLPNSAKYPYFDAVVYPLATGSVEYIAWVQEQTLKKDASTAFFNISPKEFDASLKNKMSDINAIRI